MKKLAVILVMGMFMVTTLSAKKAPAVAAKLPADFKKEVVKHIDYPKEAVNDLIEGEVWMKVTLDNESKIKIVALSATNQELGKHVKEELKDVTIEDSSFEKGNVYFMKVKFDLID